MKLDVRCLDNHQTRLLQTAFQPSQCVGSLSETIHEQIRSALTLCLKGKNDHTLLKNIIQRQK